MKKLLIGCVLVLSTGLLGAAEVAYTAGATDKNNLADAANWGGTLPTADDIGVIDCSQFGHSFLARADVAFKGLRFTANSAVLYIEDDGKSTISVGSEGVTLARGNGFVPKGRWALTSPQVWNLAVGVLDSRATYSGTAEWTVSNYQAVAWTESPRYGGMIVGKSASSGNSSYAMSFKKCDPVAAEVRVEGSAVFELPQRVSLSTLFSGRKFTKNGWSDVTFTGSGTLVVEEGDTFEVSAANLLQVPRGYLEVAGGTVKGAAAVELGSMGGTQGSSCQGSLGGIKITSGTFTMSQLHVGANSTTNRTVVQNGGTVEASTFHVGGHENVKRETAIEEYVLAGGLIKDKTGAAHDRGLVLASGVNSAVNGYSYPGVFTQTGGESTFDRVTWGTQGGFWTWDDWNTTPNGRGYGLLDLKGGTFNLPPNGLSLGRMWNAGDVKESAYDIKLRGTSVQAGRGKDIGFEMTVAPGAEPTEWNTGTASDRLTAPVDGDGTLRKTGSGTLMLTDATRFRGSIEVAEGVLDMQGVPQEPAGFTTGTDCYVLTADDLAKSLADGAAVSSWSDTTGTVTARQMAEGDVAQPTTYGVPTLAVNVFNGHAGVRFSSKSTQALAFPNTGNPLCGTEQYTVAVVYKATADGQGSEGRNDSYAGRMILGNFRNWRSKPNFMGITIDASNRLYYEVRRHDGTTSKETGKLYSSASLAPNNVGIALVSLDAEQMSLCLNNGFSSLKTTLGVGRPRFVRSDTGTKYPLYIGASDTDETTAQTPRCFDGYIAEIRIYRGRALSLPEQRALLVTLAKTYCGDATGEKYEREATGPMAAALGDSRVAPATKAPDVEWTAEFCHQNLDTWSTDYTKPELVPNAWANGGSALRFDATKQTVLKVAAPNADPLQGQKTFTLAFVFRTTTDGTGDRLVKEHIGLYSSMLKDFGSGHSFDGNNSGCGNAAVTFVKGGGVSAFHGTNYDNGSVINPRKPCRLDDGQPHVVVYSGDGGDVEPARHGTFRLMVDGVLTEGTYGYGTTWPGYDSSRPHVIGALRAGVGHFTGDISGFQFWKSQLSADEMRAISEKAALEYGFNLKAKTTFSTSELAARGLGATNVSVAAGAKLRMPLSASAPYVVTPTVTLSGAGAFEGSYRFAAGAVADFGDVAAKMEDVQIASGVVMKFGETAVCPIAGGNVSSISGAVVVDITGSPAEQCVKSRYPLLKIDPKRIAEGTTFTLVGGRSGMSVGYNEKAGGLAVMQQVGLRVIVR